MKTQTKTVSLNRPGVDAVSETIRAWLEEAGIPQRDILRIRLTMEELLNRVSEHGKGCAYADLRLCKRIGEWRLYVRYDGDRFDPTGRKESDADKWTVDLLARTGFAPVWRWRARKNELLLRIPSGKRRPERVMLGCAVMAVLVGLLGDFLPEGLKTGASNYFLSYLSDGFLRLLGAFIGMMVFLAIVTGICGIGSSADLGRIGKLMISRFVGSTFLVSAAFVFAVRFFFPLGRGTGGGSSQVSAILKLLLEVIPSNPVQPFMEGNTLQIVFLAAIVGSVLLLSGSETEGLRRLVFQAEAVVRRCVTGVCMFLPLYVFSSLVMLFWRSGTGVLLTIWKPLAVCIGLCLLYAFVYLAAVCRKCKVKASVLLPKLMPDFVIGLSTASSSVAFPTTLEINETKLGIDPSYSRTAVPIGGSLFAGILSLLFMVVGGFLAETSGVTADLSWWIILALVSALLAIATPPVAGGVLSCLAILMLQLQIPQEALALGVTLLMLLDFPTTAIRITVLHLEMILQADRLGLLDAEALRAPAQMR